MRHTQTNLNPGTLLSFVMLLMTPAIAQQPAPPPAGGGDPAAAARSAAITAGDISPAAMEVKEFEKKLEAAVVAGDVAYVSGCIPDDFVMVHSDEWTHGGNPRVSDNKESYLANVAKKHYQARDLDSVKVEMHGDIAVTHGHVVGQEGKNWFALWYERVYAKRNGKWMYISGRTVRGPVDGPDRASVQDK
jgi:hypothetical protein